MLPTGNVAVVMVTTPPAIVPVPRVVVPLVRVIVPVTPVGTVAVIVTVHDKSAFVLGVHARFDS